MPKPKKASGGDSAIKLIVEALASYSAKHPRAKIEANRRNSAIIRVRIIDPDFAEIDWVERDREIWRHLDRVPQEVLEQITMLILLTPAEAKKSAASIEFEEPTPFPV